MLKPKLLILDGEYSVHRFDQFETIPGIISESRYFWISRTEEELSVICESHLNLESDKCEPDWRVIKVIGPLDFSLIGLIADITGILSSEKISVFTLSTYDTDYILIKKSKLEQAKDALILAGYVFLD
ncbi:MAG TPA: ACT domain-containing protein [Ignavibacteriaceae bacterium]|nr:ACT domain-containing protein [Ignavibacteriaceae bacterium]